MDPIFWLENRKERSHSEDSGVDVRIILEWILEKQCGENVSWIHLAQDRDEWWALVNTVMKFRVPYKVGNFVTS
jgi:hypothetical protein